MGERQEATLELWRMVNNIADTTEDTTAIHNLISEARIRPGVHVGVDPDDFTPLMVAEWVLGQWLSMIDAESPFLNSARNISHAQYEKVMEILEGENA